MTAQPAGAFRRTAVERSDQQVSWERTDQAFFASGACHILAWTCRRRFPDRPIRIAGLRFADEAQVFHAYATWGSWAFDHSGWNSEEELLAANVAFEGRIIERTDIDSTMAEFCAEHYSRMPHQYWQDPMPRATRYVDRYIPPWEHATWES